MSKGNIAWCIVTSQHAGSCMSCCRQHPSACVGKSCAPVFSWGTCSGLSMLNIKCFSATSGGPIPRFAHTQMSASGHYEYCNWPTRMAPRLRP